MRKRTLIAALWFFATWTGYELVMQFAPDLPRIVGPLLGVAMAIVWGADPFGVVYLGSETSAPAATLALRHASRDSSPASSATA